MTIPFEIITRYTRKQRFDCNRLKKTALRQMIDRAAEGSSDSESGSHTYTIVMGSGLGVLSFLSRGCFIVSAKVAIKMYTLNTKDALKMSDKNFVLLPT